MTIERRIHVTTGIIVLFVLIIGSILLRNSYEVEKGLDEIGDSSEIVGTAFLMRTVMDEYLAHGDARPLRQWLKANELLGKAISHAQSTGTVDRASLKRLEAAYQDVNDLHSEIVKLGAAENQDQNSKQLRSTVTGMMAVRLEELVGAAQNMHRSSQSMTLGRQRLSELFVLVAFLGMIGLLVLNLHLIKKAIILPLQELATAGDVAGTDTDSKAGTRGLTETYNAAVERLQTTLNALRDETAARQQAQEALHLLNEELEIHVIDRTAELTKAHTALERELDERKKAEAALVASEEAFRSMFESSAQGMMLTTPDGGVIKANLAAQQILGMNEREICEARRDDIIDLEDSRLAPALAERARTGRFEGELNHRRKDGGIFPPMISSSIFTNAEGDLRSTVIFRDITEIKRTEVERETTIEFLRLVNESRGSEDMIRSAATFFQQRSGCDAVGIRLRKGDDFPYFEARGFPEEFVLLENYLCDYDENDRVRLDSNGIPILECMCGNVIRGRFDPSKPFFTERGSFWTNCTTDLLASTTEEDRQSRTRNRCNGQGYESVALMPLRIGDETWGLLQLNDKRKNRFTAETIDLWERLAQYLSVALAKSKAEEELKEAKEQLEIRVQERTTELEKANFDLQEEVVQRQRAEASVTAERQRLYDVLETLPVYVCLLDSDYRMPFANRYFRETFAESQGRRCYDFLFDRTEPCEICDTYTVMKTRAPHHWYWTGPNERDYDIYDFPFIDADGSFLILEMGIDITERKQAEDALNRTLADLTRSNKDLEQFAYVASHDLQEPLRNVTSCLQLLEKEYKSNLGADADQYIHYAVDSAARMKTLIQDLLAYSRITTKGKAPELVECEQALDRTMMSLGLAIAEVGAVITHDPLPTIHADDTQLLQVFQNLVGNAIKFRRDEAPRVHVSAAKNTNEWIFSVKDNGIGIESRHLDRIFVIFQRLHKRSEYQGTGMGLAIAKKVIERHGGRIWVESEPGVGTTFYFTIPEKGLQI